MKSLLFLLLLLCGGLSAFAQSTTKPGGSALQPKVAGAQQGHVAGAGAPEAYAKFFSYPTSHLKPVLIESGDPAADKALHELRLQHWMFIYDQKGYLARYGALPAKAPGGVSPAEYAKNPPARAFSADLDRYMTQAKSGK